MNYPENLKIGDTIGICAPSAGITSPEKILRLDKAIEQLESLGYKVIETESVRKDERGRSIKIKFNKHLRKCFASSKRSKKCI